MQYLYGASVQGIQSFIFKTNKLKEIVGASQLVDKIVTSQFLIFCKEVIKCSIKKEQLLISAAGNLKCFVDKATCEKIVRHFPKYVRNYASGITISQAVIKLGEDLKNDIETLEKRLKIQRNKASVPIDYGFMGLLSARRTGGVAVDTQTFDDRGTKQKVEDAVSDSVNLFNKFTLNKNKAYAYQVPFDIEHITAQRDNAWVAIVHADGNGLGNLLSNLGTQVRGDSQKARAVFTDFSTKLDEATKTAARTAFESILDDTTQIKIKTGVLSHYPFRPVVLGGDDLTVIIRADLAYSFTKSFLIAFEKESALFLKELISTHQLKGIPNMLTACAGIAYIKQAYPFHYGVHLAESLTNAAKTFSKKIHTAPAPSSLYFYKVQASFTEKLSKMKKRSHWNSSQSISFDYGPYLIQDDDGLYPTTAILDQQLRQLNKLAIENKLSIGKLRQWLSELSINEERAAFMLDRMYQIEEEIEKEFPRASLLEEVHTEKQTYQKSIVQDLIVLNSF